MASRTEVRVTNWVAFDHDGLTHYRIWKQFDGLRWFQRHEWKLDNGMTDLDEEWIPSTSGWAPNSTVIDQAA